MNADNIHKIQSSFESSMLDSKQQHVWKIEEILCKDFNTVVLFADNWKKGKTASWNENLVEQLVEYQAGYISLDDGTELYISTDTIF